MGSQEFTVPPPAYRLPSDLRLGPVLLQTADLGRSVDYYTRVLGLHPVERAAGEATLATRLDPTPLIRLRERPGATPVPQHITAVPTAAHTRDPMHALPAVRSDDDAAAI